MMSLASLKYVKTEINGDSARITLNRPERLNAASPELVAELRFALDYVVQYSEAWVVSLAGEGRAFCSGHDLKEPELDVDTRQFQDHLDNLQHISLILRSDHIIAIAEVHGYALGAGLEFALSCDYIVAEEHSVFGFPEVAVGLSVTGGISYLLPQAVGLPRAKELIMLGEHFDALEAKKLGLIQKVVAASDLAVEAAEISQTFVSKPKKALLLSKSYLEAGHLVAVSLAMSREVEAAKQTSNQDSVANRGKFPKEVG